MCFRSYYLIGKMTQAALMLTLIGLGEVKVDLADFNSNCRKTYEVLYFIKKHLLNLFELLT
jgi:hypothetical protein